MAGRELTAREGNLLTLIAARDLYSFAKMPLPERYLDAKIVR
jgi:hypothetical protein